MLTVKAERPFNTTDNQRNLKLGSSKQWFVVVFDGQGSTAFSDNMEMVLEGSDSASKPSKGGFRPSWTSDWMKGDNVFDDFFGQSGFVNPWERRKSKQGKQGRRSRRNIWREMDKGFGFDGFDGFGSMHKRMEEMHNKMGFGGFGQIDREMQSGFGDMFGSFFQGNDQDKFFENFHNRVQKKVQAMHEKMMESQRTRQNDFEE